jgi:hypothetical protein
MSELPHFFKLKVTKGDETVEVEIGGSEKFVAPGYQDVKSAALTFLNREARTKALTGQGPLLLENSTSPVEPTPSPAVPAQSESSSPTAPAPPRRKTGKRGAYTAKSDEKVARQAELEKIRAGSFEDNDRYAAAIQTTESPVDRAALITNMAHDKFGVDGLSPAEVCWLLAEKFKVGQPKKSLEKAMKDQPASFFLVAPAGYDKRQKLYRPVRGCIERVKALLKEQDTVVVPTSGNGSP